MANIKLEKILVNVDVAGTQEAISASAIYTPWIEVYAPDTNVGNVYLGNSDVDNSWIPMLPGEKKAYAANELGSIGSGDQLNLANWYVDADNNNDDLIIQYPKKV